MKILSLLLLVASAASASQKITAEAYPYLGTFTDPALSVEKSLVDQATKICGSLENVRYLVDTKVDFQVADLTQINPNGVIGGDVFHGVLVLEYPHLKVSATVTCKDE